MKKLLALLAVLGLVNVASAAISFSAVKADGTFTRTIGTTPVVFEKYTLLFDATGDTQGINALDLTVRGGVAGQNNIGALAAADGKWTLSSKTEDPDDDGIYTLAAVVGRSAIDSVSFGSYNVGNQNASPYVAAGYSLVNSMQVAFAQATPFTKINSNGLFATIYLQEGTMATATLTGGAGGNGGAKSTIGVVSLPEPATMGLLAIGALGLIRRKLA